MAAVHHLPARKLAALAGVTQRQLRAQARVRYVKVAEWQARGVVHYHAVIRLDAPGGTYQPPPARYGAALLADSIRQAVVTVTVATSPGGEHPNMPARVLTFGSQVDVRTVHDRPGLPGTGSPLAAVAVANYIAKYAATKALEAPGLPARPLASGAEVAALRCKRHYKAMMAAAWRLGAPGATGDPRLRRWAHCLGHGGHFLTKSRLLRHLRRPAPRPRRAPQAAEAPRRRDRPVGPPLDEHVVLVLRQFSYAGTGYHHGPGPGELALDSAARARDHDQPAALSVA